MFFNPAHQNNDDNAEKFSFTGILVTLKRKSISHLLSSYYYPTTAFALLSMISYLIDPDSVRFLIIKFKVPYFLEQCPGTLAKLTISKVQKFE